MAHIVKFILWLLSLMPAALPCWLAERGSGLVQRLSPVKRHTTARNLQHCYPDLDPEQRSLWVRESFKHYFCSVLETGHNWFWPVDRLQARCEATVNEALFEDARASRRGVLVLAPHFGAWEYLGIYLQKYPGIAILFKPPSHAGLAHALLEKRQRGGANLIPATPMGLRQLYAHLRAGGAAGVLPDQQPSRGQGRFAPFFGIPALTGVLAARLVQRTNCIVIASVCERLPRGRYRVHFLPVDQAIHSDDLVTSLTAVNRAVEDCVAIDPPQYLWSYRRFKTQPEGHGDFYA
jgi:KDO2-lipid IV(A) lauroyltransferase